MHDLDTLVEMWRRLPRDKLGSVRDRLRSFRAKTFGRHLHGESAETRAHLIVDTHELQRALLSLVVVVEGGVRHSLELAACARAAAGNLGVYRRHRSCLHYLISTRFPAVGMQSPVGTFLCAHAITPNTSADFRSRSLRWCSSSPCPLRRRRHHRPSWQLVSVCLLMRIPVAANSIIRAWRDSCRGMLDTTLRRQTLSR